MMQILWRLLPYRLDRLAKPEFERGLVDGPPYTFMLVVL